MERNRPPSLQLLQSVRTNVHAQGSACTEMACTHLEHRRPFPTAPPRSAQCPALSTLHPQSRSVVQPPPSFPPSPLDLWAPSSFALRFAPPPHHSPLPPCSPIPGLDSAAAQDALRAVEAVVGAAGLAALDPAVATPATATRAPRAATPAAVAAATAAAVAIRKTSARRQFFLLSSRVESRIEGSRIEGRGGTTTWK